MPINMVVVDGLVKNLALKYDANGKPEARWTLYQEENGFPLYLPCCAVGLAAERLAGELEEGQHVVITSGKVCYRKRATAKYGDVSRMEILVWSVDRLTTVAQDARSESGEGEDTSPAVVDSPELMPAPKPRTRSDPPAARLGGFTIR